VDLYFTGRDRRIDGVRSARFDPAFDSYDILGPELLGAVVDIRIQTLVEDDLSDTIAVAKVNEDDLSEVAAAVDPPHDDSSFASVFAAQLAARMSATEVAKEVELQGLFWFRDFGSC
jgi:hypothetical protein